LLNFWKVLRVSEPIGVMKCWECVEKHARDMEHHLEDIVRSMKGDKQRVKFEDWIDFVRDIRRYAHTQAKDIATDEDTEESSGNPAEPIEIIRGEKTWTEVFRRPEECSPPSFRALKPNPEHILTVCCPTGKWDETLPHGRQCTVGMTIQSLQHLHPEGEGSCPVCSGA